jgi:hypothetical protein
MSKVSNTRISLMPLRFSNVSRAMPYFWKIKIYRNSYHVSTIYRTWDSYQTFVVHRVSAGEELGTRTPDVAVWFPSCFAALLNSSLLIQSGHSMYSLLFSFLISSVLALYPSPYFSVNSDGIVLRNQPPNEYTVIQFDLTPLVSQVPDDGDYSNPSINVAVYYVKEYTRLYMTNMLCNSTVNGTFGAYDTQILQAYSRGFQLYNSVGPVAFEGYLSRMNSSLSSCINKDIWLEAHTSKHYTGPPFNSMRFVDDQNQIIGSDWPASEGTTSLAKRSTAGVCGFSPIDDNDLSLAENIVPSGWCDCLSDRAVNGPIEKLGWSVSQVIPCQ